MDLTRYALDTINYFLSIDVFPGLPDALVWISLLLIAIWLANYTIDF